MLSNQPQNNNKIKCNHMWSYLEIKAERHEKTQTIAVHVDIDCTLRHMVLFKHCLNV